MITPFSRVSPTILIDLNISNGATKQWNSKYFSFHRHSTFSLSRDTTLTKTYSTSSNDKPTESKVLNDSQKISIDDFRAREEQREEEFSNTSSSSSSSEDKNDERIQEIRSKIMEAALPFVPNHGWSRQTISKGAQSIGYPGIVHGMFPNGGIELVHYYYSQCNRQLIEQLKNELESNKNYHPTEFVRKAVQWRLQMIEPYSSQWPKALGLMSLPQNAPKSLAHLLTLIDDICYYAGDRSVDFGWYTRRIGLATIYKMTEVYMLQDKSEGHADTWTFLERRIEEGIQIQDMLSMGDQTTKKALNSAFLTAHSIRDDIFVTTGDLKFGKKPSNFILNSNSSATFLRVQPNYKIGLLVLPKSCILSDLIFMINNLRIVSFFIEIFLIKTKPLEIKAKH
ncbi:Ubiquinone biosynthesis protein COQ9, mitochondrial [Pseudolycoriella hygida]|uniref:Ubiquinone biosynthesis protein n=1 Tax=Pseudolycoriella hygida TaxID=35572 RepID=A0A9Q0S2R0_9DIPT|nr:Ubiquinone biosynthesis protein COQ9, mitochondrial [Pseudolycoriella hygida]